MQSERHRCAVLPACDHGGVEGLPEDRREHGFDNLDFEFSSFGIVDEGRCIAVRDLPEYTIELILTGQFAEDGRIWRSNVPFVDD